MKALEDYAAFTYVAWILILGFAAFVGNLTLTLEDKAQTFTMHEIVYAQEPQSTRLAE